MRRSLLVLGAAAAFDVLAARAADVLSPERGELQPEIVVVGRAADAVLAARVAQALQDDPYVYAEHVGVEVDHGRVRLTGSVRDLPDLFAILRKARRIAGNRTVVNEIEYIPVDDDGN